MKLKNPSFRSDSADVDALVVGGGISGLACAWWLKREGLSVRLWEREQDSGGKIRSEVSDGYLTERSAAMLMNFRPEVTQLLAESGLAAMKLPRAQGARNRYLIHRQRLQPVPLTALGLLASPLWSVQGLLRLLLEPFLPRGDGDAETVSQFIVRRFGRELLEKAIEPFVGGPLASDADLASASAVLPRLTALERRFGSIVLGVVFNKMLGRRTTQPSESFSFEGGMGTLVRGLAEDLGAGLHAGRPVTGIEPHAAGWRVTGRDADGSGGESSIVARQVVLSVPAPAAASLLAPLDGDLAQLLRGIAYTPLSVVHVGMAREAIRHPLDGAGFLAPRSEGLPLNGNLWVSSLFEGRAPAGQALLTSYLGGARCPQAADWSDARTISAVLGALGPMLGIRGTPSMVRINRHREALPLYHGDHPGRLAAVDRCLDRLPGLHLAANYRDGVSVRDRIASGCATAACIVRDLPPRPSMAVTAMGPLGYAMP